MVLMPAWFKKPDEAPKSPRAVKTPLVRVGELLRPESVLISPDVADKAALIETLVVAVCAAHGLKDAPSLAAKVLEREQGISTTLDTGLSLPHARVDGLRELSAGLAVAPKGILDPQQNLPIRAMFLFFSPNKQEQFSLHLQVLRSVSLLFKAELIDELAKAATSEEALKLVRAREKAA
jgi:PTS system nitrogen regulatory IIA component